MGRKFGVFLFAEASMYDIEFLVLDALWNINCFACELIAQQNIDAIRKAFGGASECKIYYSFKLHKPASLVNMCCSVREDPNTSNFCPLYVLQSSGISQRIDCEIRVVKGMNLFLSIALRTLQLLITWEPLV